MHQKKKNLKLRWTIAWRRLHKKLETIEKTKKTRVHVQKAQKAIVGITLEEIEKKKAEKPEYRAALRDQSERELKERKKKATDAKKFMKSTFAKAEPKAKIAKDKGATKGMGKNFKNKM